MMTNLNLKKVVLIMTFIFNVLIVYSQWHQLPDKLSSKSNADVCPIGNGKIFYGFASKGQTPSSGGYLEMFISHSDLLYSVRSDYFVGGSFYGGCTLSGVNAFSDSSFCYVAQTYGFPELIYTHDAAKTWSVCPKLDNKFSANIFSNCTSKNNVYACIGKTMFFATDTMFFVRYSINQTHYVTALPGYGPSTFWSSYQVNASDKLYFVNDSFGFLKTTTQSTLTSKTVLLGTKNYGQTWSDISPANVSIYDYSFPSNNIGYIVGSSGVLKTTDGGNTWNVLNNSFGITPNKVKFSNDKLGYISGGLGTLFKTIDGGFNWYNDNSPCAKPIQSIHTFNDVVYLIDSQHKIYTNNLVNALECDIYPVPCSNQLNIPLSCFPENKVSRIRIFNSLGDIFKVLEFDQVEGIAKPTLNYIQTIYTSEFPSGVYYLIIESDGYSIKKKFYVDH